MNWCCAHSQASVRPGRAEQHSDQATAQAFADAVSDALIADVGFGTLAQVVIIRRAPPKDDVDRGRRSCIARTRQERHNCAAPSVTGDRSSSGTDTVGSIESPHAPQPVIVREGPVSG